MVVVPSETPAADLVAARLGEEGAAEAREERSDDEDRAAQAGAFRDEVGAVDVELVDVVRREGVLPFGAALHAHAHPAQQVDQVLDVQDLRDVGDGDRLGGEEDGADHLQGFVLGALGMDLAAEAVSAFDDKTAHMCSTSGCRVTPKRSCTPLMILCSSASTSCGVASPLWLTMTSGCLS